MKLRNKKTGEIMDDVQYRNYSTSDGFGLRMDGKEWEYHSLAELNAEWEDYEEPKKHHFYIEPRGQVIELAFGHDVDELKEELSEIGNYFETKEEAEKAVEKLKAWKRLKDKGFKFTGWGLLEYAGCDNFDYSPQIGFSIPTLDKDEPYEYPEEIERDLDLLFRGEEK